MCVWFVMFCGTDGEVTVVAILLIPETHLLIIPYFEFNIYGIVYGQGGLGSVVSIATGYRLDGPGIESRWGQDFPHLYRLALGLIQPPVQWVPGLFLGKEWPGCDAGPSSPSSAVVRKE